MGKAAGDPPDSAGGGGAESSREEAPGEEGRGRRRWWRCAAAVLLGAAVVLSALFWLPPFAARRRREDQARRDPWAGADVVASFRLQRMISELCGNKSNLEYDIFEEIGINNFVVSVLSLEPTGESNWTIVTFGLWPYPSNFTLSPTELSILRSSLVTLVIQQSILHLTPSLFGNSYSFEILRFPGGITIIPPQTAFVPQKPDGLFNFSLNFPIDVVQDKLSELKAQMKSGLFLNEHEILYVTLTNLYCSTVAPPTVVQACVLLAVGADNKPPSLQRLKQLAQTLRNSSSGNLGLNHTVFGRVKQPIRITILTMVTTTIITTTTITIITTMIIVIKICSICPLPQLLFTALLFPAVILPVNARKNIALLSTIHLPSGVLALLCPQLLQIVMKLQAHMYIHLHHHFIQGFHPLHFLMLFFMQCHPV
ncbi:unnamed protein product [Miscanthus lutarioriparius]|uniref:DUF7036 domain-containing protein n=1 Tax=Miscanthus lutarioriparius TaxID=422564 RepID=A0A811MV05_9POAL|nr:unnamed protein product [Miscanthus lutarioriparius]